MSENRIVDCRGLACPRPVVMTREALAEAVSEFTVIVDNETSRTNVARFAESQGARVDVDERSGEFHLRIEPGSGAPGQDAPGTGAPESGSQAAASGREPAGAAAATGAAADAAPETTLAVYVSSAVMGHGDDELGTVLMAALLDTLNHLGDRLSHLILVNTGVKLAIASSPVLEEIRQLEELGIEVLVCGTCLNHFGLIDDLVVGRVSNMFEIVEALAAAGRVISP